MLNTIPIDMFKFNAYIYIVMLFLTFVIHQKFNFNYYIKKLFRLKLTKSYGLIDCYPCFSFWITLIVTLNPIIAICVYMSAIIIDRNV